LEVDKVAYIESGKRIDKAKQYEEMKKYINNKDRKRLTIRITPSLYKKLKRKLFEENTTFNDFICDMILKYIENDE
jgi:hypothetical protein